MAKIYPILLCILNIFCWCSKKVGKYNTDGFLQDTATKKIAFSRMFAQTILFFSDFWYPIADNGNIDAISHMLLATKLLKISHLKSTQLPFIIRTLYFIRLLYHLNTLVVV